ncbi:gamma-glutamylcyclotransferase [Achromobacter deleyi]|uniref:Gamma-glutamylcyclotransferase n=1 Tax=Achromobacter deleyi TaxID=1353891 RepID=A0A7T4E250_9BURK|nr:gamma-glutamylcyclotransferase family protein [Achromobacter deleyi]QQB32674.1 gamma-glutamylcyclotransferase [Achromobacter deleyi]
MSIYVFVYGTLRAGEINDLAQAATRRGLPPARHVGAATVPSMLVDFGDWPGLLPVADGRRVLGDIYEVDPALVALMDEIEEYAPGRPGCFVRRPVLARPLAPGAAPVACEYYPIDPAWRGTAADIDGDDWVAYRQARPARMPP